METTSQLEELIQESFVTDEYTVNENPEDKESSNLISSENKVIIGFYFAIGSLGVVANGFVIVVFLTSKKLRKFNERTNIYLLNQSVLDITAAIFLVLLTAFESNDPELMDGVFGEIYCRLWLNKLPLWSFLVCSTYNLVVINLERYVGILHPIWHKNHFNKNMVIATLIFIWIIGPFYNCSFLIPTSFIQDKSCFFLSFSSPFAQRFVGILTAILELFLPMFIHTFCCIKIVHFLNTRVNKIDEANGSIQEPGNKNAAFSKKKTEALRIRNQVLKTLALMTLCYTLCWVWNQVFFFLGSVGVAVDFQGSFYHFTVIAVYINCLTSPFIYVFKYQSFREEAMRLILRKKPNSINDITSSHHAVT